MFEVNNKQYILNLSTGRKIYLYYSQGSGILMRWQAEDGKWQEPVPAARNGIGGFSACLGRSDDIHVLYQDYSGNIIYMYYSGGAWYRKPVLRSRNREAGEKQLHITCCGSGIYGFYMIENMGKSFLSFQELKNSDYPGLPNTIDPIYGASAYKVLSDGTGTLYIFYTTTKEGKSVSGFRSYEAGASKCSSFRAFPFPLSEMTVVSAAAGQSGNVHISLQNNETEEYSLVHYRGLLGADNWNGGTIATSDEALNNSEIYVDESTVRVFWTDKKEFFCRKSADSGVNWDAVEKLEGFDEKNISCFCYLQNTGKAIQGVRSAVVPGYFGDAPKLAFIGSPAETSAENDEAGSLRKAISETLKLFSGNINDLRAAVKELSKKLDGLEQANRQLELDISKCGIKDKFLENDITKIRTEVDQLKSRFASYGNARQDSPGEPDVPGNTDIPGNMPLMPGTGFNTVTAEFLKGLKK